MFFLSSKSPSDLKHCVETSSLTSSIFFAAAAFSFFAHFSHFFQKTSTSVVALGDGTALFSISSPFVSLTSVAAFVDGTALFSITMSFSSPASTSALGTDFDRACHLLCLQAMFWEFFTCFSCIRSCFRFFLIALLHSFHFSFLVRLLSSQRFFSLLCFKSASAASVISLIFSTTSWYLFSNVDDSFSPTFFVRLFSVLLLCCSEIVFVCFIGAISFWCIDHE